MDPGEQVRHGRPAFCELLRVEGRLSGQIGRSLAALFNERLQRVAADFAQQHLADQKLPADQKRPYTLLIGMRSWLFGAFRELKREPDGPTMAVSASSRIKRTG